jgi:hypothetical protein
MDEVKLFSIPDIKFYNPPEFREYLVENYESSQVDHDLTIIVGITKHNKIDFFEALQSFGFTTVRNLGSVSHIKFDLDEAPLECYVTHDADTGVVIFYTNYRKTNKNEIPKIRDFLSSDVKTYYLFFKPSLMREIAEELMDGHENLEITEFTARRLPNSRFQSHIRPNYDRTISYWGDDGREALQELGYQYGVLPSRFVVNIPETIKFVIDDEGLFTFAAGNLNILFDILEKAVNESRKTMTAYDGSDFKVLPVKTAGRSFDIPSSTPVSIQLNQSIEFHDISEFKAKLNKEYTIVDFIAREGSLFLSSDLVSKSGFQFRIKADENHIKMFPDGKMIFSEFMKFYEFIIKLIDPRAEFLI